MHNRTRIYEFHGDMELQLTPLANTHLNPLFLLASRKSLKYFSIMRDCTGLGRPAGALALYTQTYPQALERLFRSRP